MASLNLYLQSVGLKKMMKIESTMGRKLSFHIKKMSDPFAISNAYAGEKFNADHPNISQNYANINLELGASHWNYRAWNPEFGDIKRYSLYLWLGSGRYSDVFLSLQDGKTKCAAKLLKPVNTDRVRRELRILSILKGGPNILELWDIVIDGKYGIPAMITEVVDNIDWRDMFQKMTLDDIRFYSYRLLLALDFTHKNGIMHRDVKPVNILCKDPKKELKLADWGLAEFYHPMRQYSPCVGTRYYKSPEILFDYEYYDYSMDIWAAGVILLEMLSLDIHIFDGESQKCEQIDTIAKVVGGQTLVDWTIKYRKQQKPEVVNRLLKFPGTPFENIIPYARRQFRDPDAVDLLMMLLKVDHKERCSAEEALCHRFFDPIRNKVYNEVHKT
ncbi:CMGC family protein kinase [Tritrichomonas foetus]|uniref:non-specific serine/threonine protein kinase n=1 Tax=Tritrichomonas foetus TaxID=1144522 RepID=A0A1J4KXH5_9EUKA|nr:CMGC family protein kinase [Tritrichomonas foetus]|eukprot:OHT14404.1 CMGC family protein kinase [Tritrichomonas foetus]